MQTAASRHVTTFNQNSGLLLILIGQILVKVSEEPTLGDSVDHTDLTAAAKNFIGRLEKANLGLLKFAVSKQGRYLELEDAIALSLSRGHLTQQGTTFRATSAFHREVEECLKKFMPRGAHHKKVSLALDKAVETYLHRCRSRDGHTSRSANRELVGAGR
jgi:hypothetical protein